MKRIAIAASMVVAAALLLAACAPPATSPTPVGTPSAKLSPAATGAPAQSAWDKVVAEAKKEGTVVVYTTWAAQVRVDLVPAFKEKYGINIELSRRYDQGK